VSDLKPDRQRRDLHKSNLPVTSRKIGPVFIKEGAVSTAEERAVSAAMEEEGKTREIGSDRMVENGEGGSRVDYVFGSTYICEG
jgi:hypothetical protein